MAKRSKVGFWWHFDRVFGDNRNVWWQVAMIVALVVALVCVILLGGWLLTLLGCEKNRDLDSLPLIQSIGLAFGTTNLPGGIDSTDMYSAFPLWWQVLAALLGAVLFGGVTITFVGNLLGNRQEAYRNGSVRYRFTDHVLFLGGGDMVATILKDLHKNVDLQNRHIVVLTDRDAAEVRLALRGQLDDEERKMKITVLRGRCDDENELRSVHCASACRLYIVGDDPTDEDYDSVNMACWMLARGLREEQRETELQAMPIVDKEKEADRKWKLRRPCYLMLERASSEHIFRHNDKAMPDCFDTTVVNRLEAVTQQVLVHNESVVEGCPPLDRGGIGPDSERTVHLVLYGMTAFSYAMAVTAAHLCHFPNFVSVVKDGDKTTYGERLDRRTRITFIAPHIEEEMNHLTSHLSHLFALSKVAVNGRDTKPAEDFLDIEWEFVDGNIAEPRIRTLLESYYADNQAGRTYLTLSLCEREARRNIAAALYLPDCFHHIERNGGHVDFERTIPVLAYQPDSEEQLRMAHDEVPLYANIFPVGSVRKSFDPSLRRRIREGKCINYLYDEKYKGKGFVSMPVDENELETIWPKDYSRQKSNIYCANHIGVKLRSVGGDGERLKSEKALTALMCVVEHNRWNVEKLLMGFGPVPKEDRDELKSLENDAAACAAKKNELDKLKCEFRHYNIAPYGQLLKSDQEYDEAIVANLLDVIMYNNRKKIKKTTKRQWKTSNIFRSRSTRRPSSCPQK